MLRKPPRRGTQPMEGILRKENTQKFPPELLKVKRKYLQRQNKTDKGKRSDKYDEKLNLESPDNPIDKKTARWIEEQNEFLGKKKEGGSDEDKRERDVPVFNPNGPVKVLQRQGVTRHTGYGRPPKHPMSAQMGQAPRSTMVVTD